MKILLHFVSGQNMPNYIASKIIVPDINIYLCSKESISQFEKLSHLFINSRKEVLDAWDYNNIQSQLKNILDSECDNEVILNFTAGNKIMSLAGFNLFKELKKECYYINTEINEFIKFDFKANMISREKIEVKCDLKDILLLNGQTPLFSNHKITGEHNLLINLLETNKRLLDKILVITRQIESKNNIEISEGRFKNSIISYKNNISKIKLVEDDNKIYEYQEKSKFLIELLTGKWFEYVCFEKLRQLNYFDNLEWGCNIKRRNIGEKENYTDKNEIDIIGNKGIYYYIFECKSGNIKADAVDKLVAIKETYIGRYSSMFFISKFPLDKNNNIHKNIIEKINDNNIIHLIYNDLSNQSKLLNLLDKKANLR